MKPVAIFRHTGTEGPGYFATYLDAQGISWKLVKVDAGEPVPADPGAYSGLVFMGGPMSVNDDLPWISRMLALIMRAADADVPLLGHCLGGQLISRALGGQVTTNPVKEIGWGKVVVDNADAARHWFGDVREFLSFHWHGETFSIPPGAQRIASSAHCANQAFVLGKHLGLQCHVEMTPEMIRSWYTGGAAEIKAHPGPTVQTAEQIEIDLPPRVMALNAIARRLYDRWIEGLAR